MKTFFKTFLAIIVLSLAQETQAQTTFVDDLNDVIDYAKDTRTAARAVRQSLKNLVIDYFQLNNPNPNVNAYLASAQTEDGNIETATDEIQVSIYAASNKNPQVDPDDIADLASFIEGRSDFVQIESQNLANAIAVNNRSAARTAVQLIRGYLGQIIQSSNLIIDEANALKQTPEYFDVRIVLVDNNGNPITGSTGLQGYFAFDIANNQYIWAGSVQGQDPDLFPNLSAGTYTFGAVDGYFDGAGSNQVTISSSLPTNSDGEIEVELVYWSE